MEKPPALFKALTAYLNRAEELDKNDINSDNKIISYYCRMWACTKGLEINKAQACIDESEKKTMEGYLKKLMADLEVRKKTLNIPNDQEGKERFKQEAKSKIELYAFEMFCEADIEDQAGAPTQFTAAKYYNSQTYFGVLEEFGPLSDDIKEKIKIAGVRALQINKAIKAGQIPLPSSSLTDISTNPSAPPVPPRQNTQQQNIQQQNIQQHQNNQYIPTPSTYSNTPSNNIPPLSQVTQAFSSLISMNHVNPNASSEIKYKDCTELCHFAIAALKHNDANLAKERLQEALRLLG